MTGSIQLFLGGTHDGLRYNTDPENPLHRLPKRPTKITYDAQTIEVEDYWRIPFCADGRRCSFFALKGMTGFDVLARLNEHYRPPVLDIPDHELDLPVRFVDDLYKALNGHQMMSMNPPTRIYLGKRQKALFKHEMEKMTRRSLTRLVKGEMRDAFCGLPIYYVEEPDHLAVV